MRRLSVLLLAVLIAAPAVASYRGPLSYTSQARDEVEDIETIASGIRDPSARADLMTRLDHVDSLLARAEEQLQAPPRAPTLSFDDARTMVLQETFDDGRLEVIRRVARTGSFTTAEARALAELCTFDSTRKDALIALYPAVTDPQRFGLALDVLTFTSSKHEVVAALGL